MSVALCDTVDCTVSVIMMKDGDIAIITEWPVYHEYVGRIIQRYGNHLISLGMSAAQAFTTVFSISDLSHYRVKILPQGTKFQIV